MFFQHTKKRNSSFLSQHQIDVASTVLQAQSDSIYLFVITSYITFYYCSLRSQHPLFDHSMAKVLEQDATNPKNHRPSPHRQRKALPTNVLALIQHAQYCKLAFPFKSSLQKERWPMSFSHIHLGIDSLICTWKLNTNMPLKTNMAMETHQF